MGPSAVIVDVSEHRVVSIDEVVAAVVEPIVRPAFAGQVVAAPVAVVAVVAADGIVVAVAIADHVVRESSVDLGLSIVDWWFVAVTGRHE